MNSSLRTENNRGEGFALAFASATFSRRLLRARFRGFFQKGQALEAAACRRQHRACRRHFAAFTALRALFSTFGFCEVLEVSFCSAQVFFVTVSSCICGFRRFATSLCPVFTEAVARA